MKTHFKVIFPLSLFLLLYPHFIFGEISVNVIMNATESRCSGILEVKATGSAGPFTITLKSLPPNNGLTDFGEVSSPFLIYDLCAGDYLIHVENLQSSKRNFELNLGGLINGIYILEVTLENGERKSNKIFNFKSHIDEILIPHNVCF